VANEAAILLTVLHTTHDFSFLWFRVFDTLRTSDYALQKIIFCTLNVTYCAGIKH